MPTASGELSGLPEIKLLDAAHIVPDGDEFSDNLTFETVS